MLLDEIPVYEWDQLAWLSRRPISRARDRLVARRRSTARSKSASASASISAGFSGLV